MPTIRTRYPDDGNAIAAQIRHEAMWCCTSEPLTVFLERVEIW